MLLLGKFTVTELLNYSDLNCYEIFFKETKSLQLVECVKIQL